MSDNGATGCPPSVAPMNGRRRAEGGGVQAVLSGVVGLEAMLPRPGRQVVPSGQGDRPSADVHRHDHFGSGSQVGLDGGPGQVESILVLGSGRSTRTGSAPRWRTTLAVAQ